MTLRKLAGSVALGCAIVASTANVAKAGPGDPLVTVPITLTFNSHTWDNSFSPILQDEYDCSFADFAFDPGTDGGIVFELDNQVLDSSLGGELIFSTNLALTSTGCVGTLNAAVSGASADASHNFTGTGLDPVTSWQEQDVQNSGPIVGFSATLSTSEAASSFQWTGLHMENTMLTQPAGTYGNNCPCKVYVRRSTSIPPTDPGVFTALSVPPAPGASIPTLSEWGMVLLAGLLGGTMLFSVRRKSQFSSDQG